MKYILFILSSIISYASFSQVLNNSFENDSLPDLTHWQWICGAQSFNNAPSGGGDWCIKVSGGNSQGCFYGFAYQKIPNVSNGQVFNLSGWAFAETSPEVGIYFGIVNNGNLTMQEGDTTSSATWKPLSIQSGFSLSLGDTAAIILWGGIVGGPLQGYGYFDMISLEEITGVYDLEMKTSVRIVPTPFSSQTTLLADRNLENTTLTVYNTLGQQVKRENNLSGYSIIINRDNLPVGLYFITLAQGNQIIATDKLLITDN